MIQCCLNKEKVGWLEKTNLNLDITLEINKGMEEKTEKGRG